MNIPINAEPLVAAAAPDVAAACFFNALLRESGGWRWRGQGVGGVAVLPVDEGELYLRVQHRSASGECRFRWPIEWVHDGCAQPIGFEAALARILAAPGLIGPVTPEARAAFRARVLESRANTHASLAARDDLAALQRGPLDFAAAEQGLLAGHAFHPAPKSRAPFTAEEAARYCPEHRARVGLAWWAVAPEIVAGRSSRDASAAELARALLPAALADELPPGFAAVPMHPWQARHLRGDNAIRARERAGRLRFLGHDRPCWVPTSSHRSLYAPGAAWMVKGSLSARLTNSLRLLSVKEVERGLRLDAHMRDLDIARRFPGFAVMHEPAWLGWRDAHGEVEPASLVLLRENLLGDAPAAEAVVLATLTQQPLITGNETLLAARVRAAAARRGQSLGAAARAWFAAFCERVLTPLFGLAVEEGIVLLAHQQNIVLRLDDGWPVGMYYRDCQGSGVSDHFLRRHPGLAPPENHWPPDAVRRYFLYYLLINSTFAVTSALAADGLIDEAPLLADLRAHLEALRARLDGDRDCLEYALRAPQLETKGNFFCYLSGVNEATLAEPARLYRPLANPIAAASTDRPHKEASTA